jgi:hypothetical protein
VITIVFQTTTLYHIRPHFTYLLCIWLDVRTQFLVVTVYENSLKITKPVIRSRVIRRSDNKMAIRKKSKGHTALVEFVQYLRPLFVILSLFFHNIGYRERGIKQTLTLTFNISHFLFAKILDKSTILTGSLPFQS